MSDLPVIDVSPLVTAPVDAPPSTGELRTATEIDRACRSTGFFLVQGHGADLDVLATLDRSARAFFARPESEKAEIAMAAGGRAWRGWFPEGGELTSGRPDHKEGLYFGRSLEPDDPRVLAGTPLHGPNRYPSQPAALRGAVERWMADMERLGHALARGVALGLGLTPDWFSSHLTGDPTVLFRVFRYPPRPTDDPGWGVAEHTDYGLLTILAHDGTPALSVRSPTGWIDVVADADTFVINIGDMLERMTAGRYRSTPHRVRHTTGATADRLSFPFFFDPAWDAAIRPVPTMAPATADDGSDRWDATSVHTWEGTYGDYLTAKVARVFPALGAALTIDRT